MSTETEDVGAANDEFKRKNDESSTVFVIEKTNKDDISNVKGDKVAENDERFKFERKIKENEEKKAKALGNKFKKQNKKENRLKFFFGIKAKIQKAFKIEVFLIALDFLLQFIFTLGLVICLYYLITYISSGDWIMSISTVVCMFVLNFIIQKSS